MRDEGKKIAKLENIVLLHACNFRVGGPTILHYRMKLAFFSQI
jgi:hypothetical protein